MSVTLSRYTFHSFLLVAAIGLGQRATAQDRQAKVVTTAVSYLRISADARSSAMGDAGIASGADAYAAFRNLAKTSFNEKKAGIAATYSPWMGEVSDGIYLAALTGFYKLKNDEAISGSVRFFQMGTTELSDENGNSTGAVTPRDLAIEAGYSRKLGKQLSLGVALRFIHSKLATGNVGGTEYKAGNAVAGDISLYYDARSEEGAGFTGGVVASNLGTKINYTKDARNPASA